MAQMVVRNIDDEIARRFKAKAKAGGKSPSRSFAISWRSM